MADVGISGVLLEQSHFVSLAELRRRSGFVSVPLIIKYVNQPANVVALSEPSGSPPFFLDHPPTFPGAANFIDQIDDIRMLQDGIWSAVSADSDFSAFEVLVDWLNNVYPNPSGADGNYAHRIPAEDGPILYILPEEAILGQSGVLYDIDIAEIMYQPTVRFNEFDLMNGHRSLSFFDVVTRHIWPCFCKPDGTLVTLNSRDAALDYTPGRVLPFTDANDPNASDDTG